MKSTLLLLALAAAALGAKTCTPSFDYCAEKLISDKGIPLFFFWLICIGRAEAG
jgi:hypothetical protein